MAPRIELRAALTVRTVQRNDLMTHEIVPRLQARRDRIVDASVGRLDKGRYSPHVVQPLRIGRVQAVFCDFEPDRRRGSGGRVGVAPWITRQHVHLLTVRKRRLTSVGAPRHVGNDRALVALRPLCPAQIHG